MKRIALLLVTVGSMFTAACKTSDSAPTPQPTPTETAPTARAQPRTAPTLAVPAPMEEGSNRPALPDEGRHHDRMAQMDTDGDGKVSPEERAAAMKQRVEKMRTRLDANGDGKLTPDELANGKGRMKFDDPAALDTNKDGDISADELEAGMKARRDEMRAQRMQNKGAGLAPRQPATDPQ